VISDTERALLALLAAISELEEMAERQEHFATPDLYMQMTEEQRHCFVHAAKILRYAIARIKVKVKL
jgi:hypothetical protein